MHNHNHTAHWTAGSRVFAFRDDEYAYPATIIRVNGDEITVRFNDDREQVTGAHQLSELSVIVGDEVECRPDGQADYLLAAVIDTRPGEAEVAYHHGAIDWVSLDQLRLAAEPSRAVGDRVFAYSEDDGYWYPATIREIDGEDITIRYDDGQEEITFAGYLEDLTVQVGEVLECKWSQDGAYYEVEILEIQDDRLQVEFEDGETEWTTLSNVRLEDEPEEDLDEPEGYG